MDLRNFIIYITFILVLVCINKEVLSNNSKVDSLKHIIETETNDSKIILSYLDIGDVYEYQNPDTALYFYNKALHLSQKIGNHYLESKSQRYIGIVHYYRSNFEKAIEALVASSLIDSLRLINEDCAENKKSILSGMANCFNNIGVINRARGFYDVSIKYYLKSLAINEDFIRLETNEIKIKEYKKAIAQGYNNLGNIYNEQGVFDKAIDYYNKSLEIRSEIEDKSGIAASLSNIGSIYEHNNDYKQAKNYYLQALNIAKEINDLKIIGVCYNNIGQVSLALGEFNEANNYYKLSLSVREQLNDKHGQTITLLNFAKLNVYFADSLSFSENQARNYLNDALKYGIKAIELAQDIMAIPIENEVANILMQVYKKLGNYKKSVEYAEIFIATNDSLFKVERTKALAEMGTKYESEKKQLEIEKMTKQKELDDKTMEAQIAENKKQQVIILSVILVLFILIVFSLVLYRLFAQKKKANILLEIQNVEIRTQKEEISAQRDEILAQRDEITAQRDHVTIQKEYIEEQKREIDSSIRYAKRIQTAVLPDNNLITNILGEHFILFKPKDVVSGDFYWINKTNDWIVVAVADCTGHGVPGAFMSMLGVSFLNEIVRNTEVTNAAEMLNQLRKSIIYALNQKNEDSIQKDGMDMSILAIHRDRKRALWAGANNPLWIIRQNTINIENNVEIEEIKPDKMPVAIHVKMDSFTNNEILLEEGDQLYMFTDGMPDQFGGPKGKKFRYLAFKKLIIENSALSMQKQSEVIEQSLNQWMNNYDEKYEQIDDITIVGIKI